MGKTTTKASKAKASTKAKAPASKPRSAKPNPRGRKLGERTETISRRLSATEIQGEYVRAGELMRQQTDLEEKKKAAGSEFTARIAEIKSKRNEALGAAATGQRDEEITVEEWLTPQNQVQRIRADTGELIGDRQARADDLQENLFDDDEPEIEPGTPPTGGDPDDEPEDFGGE
jgi:hypothetical protein